MTDKQVQAGKGLVKLYDTAGKELSGIYLGDNRKAKTSGMPISGQYVRRSDQQQVYLVPEAITVVTTLAYWLDSSLTNVMTAKIESVEQYAGAQAAAPEFTLVKDSKLGEAGRAQFSLKEGVEGDKKLKDVATTQIPSGLENLATSLTFLS